MAVDKPTEEQKVEHVAEAVRSSIRFPALANAGGAIGTVSIISSTAKDGDIINILALPLGLFLFGVFLTLLAAARALYTVSHMASGGNPNPLEKGFNWFKDAVANHPDALHILPIACFFFGCFFGIIIIIFA